jgi:hypothetical protein
MKNLNTLSAPAAIVGAALIIAAVIGAWAFVSVRSLDNTLVVTGSAKQAVTADNARWNINVNRVVAPEGVAGAYTRIAADTTKVREFLAKNGVKPDEVTVSPIFVDEYWGGRDNSRQNNVRQIVTVKSADVRRVKTMSENTVALAQSGAAFSPEPPQYYVSTLPQLRVSLLGDAVKDARSRALEIAKSTGQSVGKLKSATGGVVQVLQPNSIDVSDYGQYDTSTIEKEVMITVRAVFILN